MTTDLQYMRRALTLAARGAGHVSPNPMVGAVIVSSDGRIIGEGWHRKYGGPHAEVNAFRSVKSSDTSLLKDSTLYVTLEPCSHYGKTPPCSKLVIEKGIKRVVIGMRDPFREVSGRGINMLKEAGIEVIENVLEEECREINKRFLTAHTLGRPWILLKWAQSSDNFISAADEDCNSLPVKLSSPVTLVEMHKERTMCDAILVGTNTVISDNPALTSRLWPGNQPRPILFSSTSFPADSTIQTRNPIILDRELSLRENLSYLYNHHNITSLMVEGGRKILDLFIHEKLFDEIRVEYSAKKIVRGIPAPDLPDNLSVETARKVGQNSIKTLKNL